MYVMSVANVTDLKEVGKLPYFTERLSEAEMEEEKSEAVRAKQIEAANNLLAAGVSVDIIAQSLGLDIDTVQSLL